jgi:ABC-type nitrate/sulfonate/bicarbonate transport system substrate-binding protein
MKHCSRLAVAAARVAAAGIILQAAWAQSPSGTLRDVRVSVTSSAAIYLPFFVAGSAGYFAGQGIQVRLDETAGATSPAAEY